MKNWIFLSFMLVSVMGFAQSDQNAYRNVSVEFGPKIGLNRATVTDGDYLTGFTGGIYVEIPMGKKLALRSESLYSRQGAKAKGSTPELKLNYLNFPVLAKYYVGEKFSLEGGPQIGFLLSGKGGHLVTDDYKVVDFSVAMGVNYRIIDQIEVGLRFTPGLTDITKPSGNVKNTVFQLGLSFSL